MLFFFFLNIIFTIIGAVNRYILIELCFLYHAADVVVVVFDVVGTFVPGRGRADLNCK
jgi:hypothetical protein